MKTKAISSSLHEAVLYLHDARRPDLAEDLASAIQKLAAADALATQLEDEEAIGFDVWIKLKAYRSAG